MIPYGKHSVDESDVAAVVEVLETQFLTQGSVVPKFEQALSRLVSADFCVATNSGTSALHIACLAAGVGQGDRVWTSPITFAASANCALYCGAEIDFVDIDAETRNICFAGLQTKLRQAQLQARLPKVIVTVHFAGLSCDMKAIRELTKSYGIVLIEDAAHALGGSYLGQPIGNCQYSDMTVFSFHPVKAITSAEGGAVVTNQAHMAQRLALYCKHGITRDVGTLAEQQPWLYEQRLLGFNYRLSDLHASLGLSQLAKLSAFIEARRTRAKFYSAALADLPLKLPRDGGTAANHSESAWHIYVVECLSHDRTTVYKLMQEKGIGVNVHYIPVHTHPYYQALGFRWGDFPKAENFYKLALTLPLYPSLTELQQEHIVQSLREVLV